MDRLESMSILVTAVEAGGLSAAGRRLGTPLATVGISTDRRISEIAATSALKASEGFTKLTPSAVVVVGYGVAFYFLSLTLDSIPVGVHTRCGRASGSFSSRSSAGVFSIRAWMHLLCRAARHFPLQAKLCDTQFPESEWPRILPATCAAWCKSRSVTETLPPGPM
jgi:Small Multidrug Resistance protein